MKRVVIYGAGVAGAQLANSINIEASYLIQSFIDDSPKLWDREIYNIPINPPQYISKLIVDDSIDEIFIAIPSLTKKRRNELIRSLKKYRLPILQVPSLKEISQGNVQINTLKPLLIQDLLGRDEVPPDLELISKNIEKKSICITGAGGSIGTEICLQILDQNPSKLILLERCENNLYNVFEKLKIKKKSDTELISLLGSADDYQLVNNIFSKFQVDIVFHTAAYKHVPIVEENRLQAIKNNILSTEVLCKASYKNNVSQMILISSDKAVRPSNVMGATKRVSEMIVQSFYQRVKKEHGNINKTLFSMVRFGNVLGSSGSVVPLFSKQIIKGGPLTITHPEITRYFMTIKEAAQLVLQTAAMARGGELFLLDMGDPILIKTLAKQMIRLNNLTIKNKKNPSGEIEIVYTGLRPGEKLYEELLIDSNAQKTFHPLIYKAFENPPEEKQFINYIEDLKKAINDFDEENSLKILSKLVPEWVRKN